jgi:methylated-DNA-[protein]-cysteine S-methyltransferase
LAHFLHLEEAMAVTIYLDVFEAGFLGKIGLAVSADGLLRLRMFVKGEKQFLSENQAYQEGVYIFDSQVTQPYRTQISEYLKGERKVFSLPIDWKVYTPFQEAVLKETLAIPYGETRSYGEVAAAIGKPKASRAVGQAEKSNHVPLVIPCHRVIGSDGSLTGYGGSENTDTKSSLIQFERVD